MRFLLCLLFAFSANNVFAQSTATKQVSCFEIASPELQTSKRIWVYLPKSYATSKKRYPVLYMHDAQNLFDSKTSFGGEWNVDEKLDSISADVIIIGIEHGNDKRIDELTPFPNEKYGGGKADAYIDFIVKTLKPAVDVRYRTKTNARNTGIMGSSLGGLVSLYAAVKHSDTFGKAGVFSPSFWFSEEIYHYISARKKLKAKIYFLAGDSESDDMVSDLEKMYSLIDTKRCDCLNLSKKKIVKEGQHNEKLWRENFLNAYLWMF
ncbi:MAG TPA: alpha/beta hydrolase-fold protein [Flavobacterium sp.]|jgi:predicted alpha/beta superfamily hydrolase